MSLGTRSLHALFLSTSLIFGARSSHAQCLNWSRDFAPDGISGIVQTMTVFDDGAGPMLFAAGQFNRAGAINTGGIAKWNGSGWLALTTNFSSLNIDALQVFDDGSGPALYAAGSFSAIDGVPAANIARWDGTQWSALGTGANAEVRALAVFDDGTGPALYAGGDFLFAGGVAVHSIAKWDGSAWSALGMGINPGPNNRINALAVYTNNGHTALYAGGVFDNAGTVSARCLARWNGSLWSDVDGGVESLDPAVHSLSVFDDGSGEALVVAGTFDTAGTLAVKNIARWRASTWSTFGSGLGVGGTDFVYDTLVYDDGSGPKLHAGGTFLSSASTPLARMARWNGSAWQALSAGVTGTPTGFGTASVRAFCAYDDGSGSTLYVGGLFGSSGALGMNSIASLQPSGWKPLGTHHGLKSGVSAVGVHDDGSGPALYVGGYFDNAGGAPASRVARWDGDTWQPLGPGVIGGWTGSGPINAFATFDDGNGPALYATGAFNNTGVLTAHRIARWDGTAWSQLGSGLTDTATSTFGACLAVFDDGTGSALYVGGDFSAAGGNPAANIARWDGTSWSALGAGIEGTVYALIVFDDGNGPALFAGGAFSAAGGVPAQSIARWDGSNWTPLPSGGPNAVRTFAIHHDGTRPALYVGGYGGVSNSVAKWDGTSWTSGIGGSVGGQVRSLVSFDDGAGPKLYAAGEFLVAGGDQVNYVARLDDNTWTGLNEGVTGIGTGIGAFTMCVYEAAASGAPSLFVGGRFDFANGKPSLNLAEWFGCGSPGEPLCFGDGSGAACPCGNSGEAGHGCDNSQATGGAVLESSGWTSLAFDSLHLTASGTLPNAASIFLQGNQQVAPVFFGDGLRCAGGSLIRLFVKAASGGVVSAPDVGDPSISERSSIQGDTYAIGTQRLYQVYYRDADPVFCSAPPGNTWNATNALRVGWLP